MRLVNPPQSVLIEHALTREGCRLSRDGALVVRSGERRGRVPAAKRVCSDDPLVWRGEGSPNQPLTAAEYARHRRLAVDHLDGLSTVYVIEAYACWDPRYRHPVRVVCGQAYHALFMWNMLVRPDEGEAFDDRGCITIYNAGELRLAPGEPLDCSVDLNFDAREMVILGTQYAGEMKKGVFTFMHYLLPPLGVLTLHSSVNVSRETGDATVFFGLSGTGKTTLSADPDRLLVGDDEHGWSADNIFNIEGGCYAKCIGLTRESEPMVHDAATRYGAILENVMVDEASRRPDFAATDLTPNTRASYRIDSIGNALLPCRASAPTNIVLLTCDAFGVLPPVSRLNADQLAYHFLAGYTAKIPGTEVGVRTPVPTFSPCYGHPFLAYHPSRYADMLREKPGATAWLINTGWIRGAYGEGQGERIPLRDTRAILDAIHSGELAGIATEEDPVFGLAVPERCPGVPTDILRPIDAWPDRDRYLEAARALLDRFPAQ